MKMIVNAAEDEGLAAKAINCTTHNLVKFISPFFVQRAFTILR
jgi:hypothetical protein